MAEQLRSLARTGRRWHNISIDERNAMTDALESMSEEYVEGFEVEDTSDDDDL